MSDAHDAPADLGAGFSQYFEFLPALDAATRQAVYRIRHEVYCRDLGWEPVRDDGLEQDEFDAQSIHCLLRRKGTGEPVGCTRLILRRPGPGSEPLPFEHHCDKALHRHLVDPAALPPEQQAEVSRLAVMRNYRQRKGEQDSAVALSDDDFASRGPQSRFPYIPVGLYLGVASIAQRLGREYVFVLTEPRLARHFSRIGFAIDTVGDAIEHRGLRAPSLLRASQFMAHLRASIHPLYDVIDASVAAAFAAHPEGLRV